LGWPDENAVAFCRLGLARSLWICCAWGPEALALSIDKELGMDVAGSPDGKVKYKTPRWVQAWFLGRSRDRWKRKYQDLKLQAKRLQNRVADVTKSRQKWRAETRELRRRIQELETQNAALQEQAAALKKGGPDPRPGRR
jgi:Basic region leucine zipper